MYLDGLKAMKNKYHVYIPSKGRASHCLTALCLKDTDLDFTIVVEPQEYKEYLEHFPASNLHKLKKNGQGLTYSRNSILKLSRRKGETAHWQMDDDIKRFMVRKDDKNVLVEPATSVRAVERYFDAHDGLGAIAHRYTSFAFSYTTDYTYSNNPCSSQLLRNDMKAVWRKGTADDVDFALQVLTEGWATVIANRQLIDTVPHNKQKGGLTDTNPDLDGRRVRFEQLMKDWPDGFNIKIDETGWAKLIHRRIWGRFKQRPIPKGKKIKKGSELPTETHHADNWSNLMSSKAKGSLKAFKPAKYNPRKITAMALKALNKSIEEFGDLSGVVINRKTNTIVAGHQRITTLKDKKNRIVTEPFKDSFGTVETGFIEVKSETGLLKVPLRIVEWDLRKEKLANIAANNHGGEFDNQKLGKLLAELNNSKFDIESTGFTLHEVNNLVRKADNDPGDKYVRTLASPIYKIRGKKPTFKQMHDTTKADAARDKIKESGLDGATRRFLTEAAGRLVEFNYANIAEFYAHADKKTQALMEELALVIVDADRAIELGYLTLTKEIAGLVKGAQEEIAQEKVEKKESAASKSKKAGPKTDKLKAKKKVKK